MDRNLDQIGPGSDNNGTQTPGAKSAKRGPQGDRWLLTCFEVEKKDQLLESLEDLACKCYIIGEEICPSTGNSHLQGYAEFNRRVRPRELKALQGYKIHWGDKEGKPCYKGSPRKNMVNYCAKDGKYTAVRCRPARKMNLITPDRWWQKEILEQISKEPDDRTIHWYWCEKGGTGKTSFCKYLTMKHGGVPVCGKGADVRNGICSYYKENGETPDLVIFPIPRSHGAEYVSYEAIENIKDMYFYSGKYEGGAVCGPCPHLYVFANFPPEKERMTSSRWHIVQIDAESAPPPPPAAILHNQD